MILIRMGKFLMGLFFIPACVTATVVFKQEILSDSGSVLYFFAGLFSYLLLLAIFQQPIRTYIFGHELTHVLWVWLFGGRVKGFKASTSGGSVRASKANFLIFLAPYFFPLYSILALLTFFLLSLFIFIPHNSRVLSFILGFTWAFHITFTLYVIVQGQPDIRATGRIFSFPIIYLGNIIILASLIIFVSPRLSYGQFFSHLWSEAKGVYDYIWTNGPAVCQENFALGREKITNIIQ